MRYYLLLFFVFIAGSAHALGLNLGLNLGYDTPAVSAEQIVDTWSRDGTTLTTGTYPSIAPHEGNQFVLIEADTDEVTMNQWNGTSFSVVGSAFDVTTLSAPNNDISTADTIFKISDSVFVWADHNSDDLIPFIWNGSSFSAGTIYAIADTSGYANGSYLANSDAVFWAGNAAGIQKLYLLRWSGSAISEVGNALDVGSALYTMPVGMSETRAALINTAADTVQTYDHDGSDWSTTGNSFSLPTALAGIFGGEKLDDNTIVIYDNANIQAITFDDTDWATEGSSVYTGQTSGSIQNPRWFAKVTNGETVSMMSSNRNGTLDGTINVMDAVFD